MKMKTCTNCFEWKSLDEYHNSSASRDGHLHQCKVCVREKNRKRYWRDHDQVIARRKEIYHDRKSGRRWRKAGEGLEDRQVTIYL